jgi:nucleotide-binding universal stress UspA family protein
MAFLPRHRIVAPVDFSDYSEEVVRTAMEIAGEAGTVHIVHVLPDLSPAEPGIVWGTIDDKARIAKAREALRARFASLPEHQVHFEVRIGDPGQEIADFATRTHADLIVIASHGRTGIKRLLIGSVAERVARLAHCPVLVLRK